MSRVTALALFVLLIAPPAWAAGIDAAFAGKTMSFIIGTDTGGGYDAYSRLLAAHLDRHIPGNPTIVPQNMPGAEGLKAANYLYKLAPQNGLAIGMVDQGIAVDQMLGRPGVEFDARRFNWIGRMLRTTTVLIAWQDALIAKATDLRSHELIVASTGTAARANYDAMNELAGTHFKIIGGYRGTNDGMLALERGEVQGIALLWVVLKQKSWFKEGKVRMLLQTALDHNPALGELPRMVDLAQDAQAAQVLGLFSSPPSIGRSIVAPPGVPPEIITALRQAFDDTIADPAFRAQAAKSGLDIDSLPGEALQQLVAGASDIPPAIVARARAIAERR